MNELLDPKPIGNEKSFSACQRPPFAEDPACYEEWESLARKLFVQFQFFYEYLGPGSAARKYLEQAGIKLPDHDPFGETKTVHLQLFFADGTKATPYKFSDGCNGDLHFCAIEPNNLFAFAPAKEFAPLVFPTAHNYYEESVNKTFLDNKKYDKRPAFPIQHKRHQEVFTRQYFKRALKIPAELLTIDFECGDNAATLSAVRTLNFSLSLFYAVCLLESGYIDLFGRNRAAGSMIRKIEQNWRLGSGRIARGLNSYHLFILNFLIKLSHLSGYGIAASLFRLKNGAHSYNNGHGTWQIGGDNDHTPYKIFLEKQIRLLVKHWCEKISSGSGNRKKLVDQINTAVKLGELFGLGYQVDPQISKAYSYDKPIDFRPNFIQPNDLPEVNFIAKRNTESPLWRVYYIYSRKMWKTGRENQQIFGAFGEAWELNRDLPRAVQYNIIHEYQIKFLLENINFLAATVQDKAQLDQLNESAKKLLGTINEQRGRFILSTLA